MTPIETYRCPSCGVLHAVGETLCRRCLSPLLVTRSSTSAEPTTGETSSLYRAATGALLLFSRSAIEYTATGIALVTTWSNVEAIVHNSGNAVLWLYHTPQNIKLSLSGSAVWFSDITRSIPLQPFGYPANRDLRMDLVGYAPRLQRFLPSTPHPRD